MRTVQQILEDAGYEVRCYSGRGMGGEECLAVMLSPARHIGDLFADVLLEVRDDCDNRIVDAFRGMRQDALGKGSIVYFPRIKFEE